MNRRTDLRAVLTVGMAAVSLLMAGCENSPTAPSTPALALAASTETAAYTFHYAEGDRVNPEWQETFHAWALQALELQTSRRIVYNKYQSRAHMGDLTGKHSTNGFAEPETFTIHTLWSTDNHEVVHVLTSLIGTPVPLLDEGIAVAHQVNPANGDFTPRWNNIDLHDLCRQFRRQGRLFPIGELVDATAFRRVDSNITYPEAGSFVRHLLQTFGLAAVKRAFAGATRVDPPDVTRRRFEAAFGITIEEAERRWLLMLDGR